MKKKSIQKKSVSKAVVGTSTSAKKVNVQARKEVKFSVNPAILSLHSKQYYTLLKEQEVPCYVAPSRNGGKGLYSMNEANKASIIMEYTGKRIPVEKIQSEEKLQPRKYANAEYMLRSFKNTVIIDGAQEAITYAKYANHSCELNCEYVTEVMEDKDGNPIEFIFIVAKRHIYLFEEITVSYNWEVNDKDVGIVCNCRSPKCLGMIGVVNRSTVGNRLRSLRSKSKK